MGLKDIYKSTSNFLRADDLQGKKPVLTISNAEVVEKDYDDGQGPKSQIVLSFHGTEKVLGLNFTNASKIAALLDSEEEQDWIGQTIKLYVEKVKYQNKMVDAIRVFPELPAVATAPAQTRGKKEPEYSGPPNFPNGTLSSDDDSSDDIPF